MAKNEVATIEENANALATEADLAIFGDYAGADFEDTNASDFVIPRITLLGDLSPQIKKSNAAKYIEGAEVGDIIDAGLNVKLKSGFAGERLHLLPVRRIKEVIEWKPRTAGGGIVSRTVLTGGLTIEKIAKEKNAKQNEKFEWKLDNGNELIETWQLYCIDIEREMPVFVPFKKSNIKMVKPWFTQRANAKFPDGRRDANGRPARLPLFFRTIHLGSFLDSGNGNEWSNYDIKEGEVVTTLPNGHDLAQTAKDLIEILSAGAFKTEMEGELDNDGEDIPF